MFVGRIRLSNNAIIRLEWIVAAVLAVVVVYLLVVNAQHAGALWRDECDSLQEARMPSAAEMIDNLPYTSFPILFPITVRVYTTLFGASDFAMRFFGLLIGVAMVCLAWLHSKTLHDVPLMLPALIGLNAIFLTIGTTIRGYGLGSVLVLLAFTATVDFLRGPSRWNLAVVGGAYIASMHCLYFNGVLVPGIVLAAVTVLYLRRQFRWMLALLGVALVCGLSYVPYLITVFSSTKTWAVVLSRPIPLSLMWQHLSKACGAPVSAMPAVWVGVLGLAVIGAIWRLIVVGRTRAAAESDLILFALISIFLSIFSYFIFLRILQKTPSARYFLALLCVFAVAIDSIISVLSRIQWVRLARLVFVIGLMIALPSAAWPMINQRLTNIDTIAQKVEREAGPNDLIVLNPWSLGVSFNHYYHGPVRWITVPQLTEHRIHRYDLLKAKMAATAPIEDVENEIRATLKSGNRVWIVGGIRKLAAGSSPLTLSPAPDPKAGWQLLVYRRAWTEQLSAFVQQHVNRAHVVALREKAVSSQENVELWTLDGWWDY